MSNKIIRSLCYYSSEISKDTAERLKQLEKKLFENKYVIQTKRICSPNYSFSELDQITEGICDYVSIGNVSLEKAVENLDDFFRSEKFIFNVDLTSESIEKKHVDLFFEVMREKAGHTFNFTYIFNGPPSSPFFPSGHYEQDGFCLGLQVTDLAEGCERLQEWFDAMKFVWDELYTVFKNEPDFLGIDSSIAPLFSENSSLLYFVKRLGYDLEASSTTTMYIQMTDWIKKENPKPIGLCGLMLPCLEDFELAQQYEHGNFPIERNLYLSLHCGLGIDAYPIGTDERPERLMEILQLVQKLSNKYKKPLSARFVSDGKAGIGEKTDFQNQYLQDVFVRRL